MSGFQTNVHAPTTISADVTPAFVHHQQDVALQQHTPRTTAVEKTPAIAITTEKAHAVTEIANATRTTAAATEPEANQEPTKVTPVLDESRKLPATNYRHRHRPKRKKKKAKSSNATLPLQCAPQPAREAAAENPIADANRHPDEATANALAPLVAPRTAKLLRGETAAAAPRVSTDMCLVEGRLESPRAGTAVVIVRDTRRNAGSLIATFLEVRGRGVGAEWSSGIGIEA